MLAAEEVPQMESIEANLDQFLEYFVSSMLLRSLLKCPMRNKKKLDQLLNNVNLLKSRKSHEMKTSNEKFWYN